MTAREFVEWQWFDAYEGLPDRRDDWRAGTIAAVIANVNRKKGAKPFMPRDFMWRTRAAPARPRKPGADVRVGGFFSFLAGRAAQSDE